MKKIVTVLGEIRAEELGFCSSHEHLSISKGYPATVISHQRIDDMEKSKEELLDFYKYGGRAVVDAQPLGCCRDAEFLYKVSQRSNVHIIASTGFHKLIFYPETHWVRKLSRKDLSDIYIAELTEGMYLDGDNHLPKKPTTIRAGQIKTALDAKENWSLQYETLFEAAIDAAKVTEAPLMVHIENDSDPLALMHTLKESGIDLRKVIFCHMDRSISDINIHKQIAEQGIYLEYDTIARPKYHSDEEEIMIVKKLLEEDYSGQLLMGLDTTRDRLKAYGGSPGLEYLLNKWLPLMINAGLNEEAKGAFIDNPKKIFAWA